MRAQVILGPGARQRHIELLRSTGFSIDSSMQFRCDAETNLVIVLGGDGTIHRFLPELILSRKPVLVVPCGSGNDLARALNIRSIADAVKLAHQFLLGGVAVREIDLGIINDSSGKQTLFCCSAGVGLDAAAAQIANSMPQWLRGHGGYLLAALWALLKRAEMKLTISVGTAETAQRVAQRACLFTMANTPSFGGGLRIAPQARVDDGELDCVLADAMNRPRLARAALALLRSTHLDLPQVHFLRGPSIRLESYPAAIVYADGEFVCKTPIEVKMHPGVLRVLGR